MAKLYQTGIPLISSKVRYLPLIVYISQNI